MASGSHTGPISSSRSALSTEIELLKITYDTLILQISSTSFTEGNVPYEFSRTSWIGDAIRLKVDVTDIEHSLEIAT